MGSNLLASFDKFKCRGYNGHETFEQGLSFGDYPRRPRFHARPLTRPSSAAICEFGVRSLISHDFRQLAVKMLWTFVASATYSDG